MPREVTVNKGHVGTDWALNCVTQARFTWAAGHQPNYRQVSPIFTLGQEEVRTQLPL